MRDCSSSNAHLVQRRKRLAYRLDWIVAVLDETNRELEDLLPEADLNFLEIKGISEIELLKFVSLIGQVVLDTGSKVLREEEYQKRQEDLLYHRRALLNLQTETRREIRFITKILDERAAQVLP